MGMSPGRPGWSQLIGSALVRRHMRRILGLTVTALIAVPGSAGAVTFGPAVGSPYSSFVGPAPAMIADVDEDGVTDVLLGSGDVPTDETFRILKGLGHDTFSLGAPPAPAPTPVPTPHAARDASAPHPAVDAAAADFNGDGHLDAAFVGRFVDGWSVALGDGTGKFSITDIPAPAAQQESRHVAVGDFDDDGHADVVVSQLQDGTVRLYRGDGAGSFTPGATVDVGGPAAMAAGDVDGDHDLDLAVADTAYDAVQVLLGDGEGGLAAGPRFTVGPPSPLGGSPLTVSLGDVDGDGTADIVAAAAAGIKRGARRHRDGDHGARGRGGARRLRR